LPKADPEAARETAVKHLFRHLRDEQQLLRNPLVGPELLGGKLTAQELRARVASAATIIRDEDVRLGRAERGHRQWATLIRCDLGSQTVASLADEFAISPRQLARERREAWLRTLQHILTKTAHITPASVNDIVNNRALALFRIGRDRDAAQIMREHIVRSVPETALFCLCSLALMQYDFKRGHDARETYKELTTRFPSADSTNSQTRLSLTLCLLSVLLGQANPTRSWNARIHDLARRAALETPTAPWVSRTILHVLFSLAQRFICTHDYANMLAIRYALDEITPSYEELDCYEALSLHALKAISEWKRNGFNADMEANMLRALHLAVSNGWTAVVAEGASLLASVYYVRGNLAAAREYRDMALIAVSLTDDKGSIALTYSNLATAALDSGCVDAAAQFSSLSASSTRDEHSLLEHVPLVGAEILVRQGQMKQGTAQARDVLRAAHGSGNHRLVAIAGRVVALGLDAAGENREAITVMKRSLDLSAAGCCSKYDIARIEGSYHEIARMEHGTTSHKLTFEHFWR
jgi:tetratricopeptide (TPR) repeat protein